MGKYLFLSSNCQNFYHLTYFAFLRSTIFLKHTPIFACSASSLQLISDNDHNVIERFVISIYNKASICTGVNQCGRDLFLKESRMVENITPTLDALRLHMKTARLQSRWVIRSNAYQFFICYHVCVPKFSGKIGQLT